MEGKKGIYVAKWNDDEQNKRYVVVFFIGKIINVDICVENSNSNKVSDY